MEGSREKLCQDLSIAGKRAGLAGDRSGLWFEFHRVLLEVRPRWVIIENVAGLLSSNKGRDFATILQGLEEVGFSSISWSILDSQYFGVPQRRRRLFIVGGPREQCAEKILSICEGGCGDIKTSREKRKKASGEVTGSFGIPDKAMTLDARDTGLPEADHATYIPELYSPNSSDSNNHVSNDKVEYVPKTVGTLSDGAHMGGGLNGQDAYTGRIIAVRTSNTTANGQGVSQDLSHTLDGANGQAVAGKSFVRRLTPTECERLQGLPDGWTCLCNKNPCVCPSGHRYRMLGNAVTTNVVYYIAKRIKNYESDL